MTYFPEPPLLGLPDKFPHWREHQSSIVEEAAEFFTDGSDNHRFLTSIAPTGSGKSIAYVALAKLLNQRTFILTSTKALQDQLMKDFSEIGMVDIRGRNSYPCIRYDDGTRCDKGVCTMGVQCKYRFHGEAAQFNPEPQCYYYRALSEAFKSNLIVTNYAYWATMLKHNYEGMGTRPGLLICDEAHNLPEVLSTFMSMRFTWSDSLLKDFMPHYTRIPVMSVEDWVDHTQSDVVHTKISQAKTQLYGLISKGNDTRQNRRDFIKVKSIQDSFEVLREADPDNWVAEHWNDDIIFNVIWPYTYGERVLFRKMPHIFSTSASICEKTTSLLGVKSLVKEYPHTFPKESRMLYHIPTVYVRYDMDDKARRYWLSRIDQIIDRRRDRKGILHTISYARAKYIMEHSRNRDIMTTHNRKNTASVVSQFKAMEDPVCLVSPVLTTGYDFPGDECRYQIIAKVPYPDTRGLIMKERKKRDKEYVPYITAMTLQQMCGRGTRAEDDWCENFIVDNSIRGFMKKWGKFMAGYFKESFKVVEKVF